MSWRVETGDCLTKAEKKTGGSPAEGDERSLLEGLQRGDSASAERFVRLHIGWMRQLAFRIVRDRSLADDCVQEAFIKAFAKIGEFEGRSTLKTWMHRVTVNEALMKLRSRRRAGETPIDDLLPEFDTGDCRLELPWGRTPSPLEVLESQSLRDLARSKILELPENFRVVLLLRDIEELSTNEVAELLGITESNVKTRLHRARSALKKLLEPILRGTPDDE